MHLTLEGHVEIAVGRSSDSRTLAFAVPTHPRFPGSLGAKCFVGLSFPFTAAGQFRGFTGFPFERSKAYRQQIQGSRTPRSMSRATMLDRTGNRT